MDQLRARLFGLFGHDALRGSTAAFTIKLTSAIAGFAMFALASRSFTTSEFGALVMLFNATSFLAATALLGQETNILRTWGEYLHANRPDLARGSLLFGVQSVLVAACVMALGFAVVWPISHPDELMLDIAASMFLILQALLQFNSPFGRAVGGIVVGDGPDALWRVAVVGVLAVCYVFAFQLSAAAFFFIVSAAMTASLVIQSLRVAKLIPDSVRRAKPRRDMAVWIKRSFKMWLASLMDTTSQYLEVVLVGLLLGTRVAAIYFVAVRITNVFSMIAASIAMYATQKISSMFFSGQTSELQAQLRLLSIQALFLVAAGMTVVLVLGDFLLWLFGPEYVGAHVELVILAVGTSLAALAGPTTHVLLLTGHEGLYARVMGIALVGRFVLIAGLGVAFGLTGAAAAASIAALCGATALVVACRRTVGVDPSILALAHRQPAALAPDTRSV